MFFFRVSTEEPLRSVSMSSYKCLFSQLWVKINNLFVLKQNKRPFLRPLQGLSSQSWNLFVYSHYDLWHWIWREEICGVHEPLKHRQTLIKLTVSRPPAQKKKRQQKTAVRLQTALSFGSMHPHRDFDSYGCRFLRCPGCGGSQRRVASL